MVGGYSCLLSYFQKEKLKFSKHYFLLQKKKGHKEKQPDI